MDFSSRSQPQNHHEPQQQIQSYDSPQIQFNYSYSQPPNNVYHDQPDYSNAYQSAPLQHLPEAAVSNPLRNEVAVAQFKEADGANLDLQHPSAYYPALNPAAAAAVVALSHLAQFAGTMDAAERVVVGLHTMGRPAPLLSSAGQFPYMDGGRRGGGAFRGGGHGKFGHRNSPSFYQRGRGRGRGGHGRGRGRGRGRGGPKHFSPHDPESSASQEVELKNENAEPLTDAPEKAAVLLPDSSLAAAPEKVVPSRQPTNAAWCELCRVNCTSLEILEQHKNGKRHKKNLLRTEELRKIVKPITEVQNEQEPVAESRIEASQYQEFEQGGIEIESVENIDKETVLDENKTEADNRNYEEGQSEVPAKDSSNLQAGKPRIDFDNWKCGMKRKMKGARRGKLMKRFAGSRQQTEPPKPKVVIPLICDLCNVKCDTQEVLDRHLSGKKHIAKLKRFESHQAMYGPIGVQSLYPPNPIAQTLYHAQGHHQPPVYDSKGLFPPSGPYMPPQSQQPPVTSAGMNHAFQQHYPIGQTETADASGGHNTVLMVSETQQQVSTTQPEIRQASVMEANDHIV